MKTHLKKGTVKTQVVIAADFPGWNDIYLTDICYVPREGESIDIDDKFYPEHQDILRLERIQNRADVRVKSVSHLFSENEHTIMIFIHCQKTDLEKIFSAIQKLFKI